MKNIIIVFLFLNVLFLYACNSKDQETIGNAPAKIIDRAEKASRDVSDKYSQYNTDSILNEGE